MRNPYLNKIHLVARTAMEYKPKRVLDVGCGDGWLVKILRGNGVEAFGIDIDENAGKEIPEYFTKAEAKKLPFPDNSFDVVVSNDFFEHIPEEDIDRVYSEMRRVGKNIVARICVKEKEWEGHVTIKPPKWWIEKLPECRFIGKHWYK